MKKLDDFAHWSKKAEASRSIAVLIEEDQALWQALPSKLRLEKLRNLCEKPLDDFSVVYRWYFRVKWLEAFGTVHSDWFEILPQMIEWIGKEFVQGSLGGAVKHPFVQLIRNCLGVVKPGGYMAISHYMFQYDLDLGYNQTLWQEMVPLIRPWV